MAILQAIVMRIAMKSLEITKWRWKNIYLANIPRALRRDSIVWHSVNQLSLTDHRSYERAPTSEIRRTHHIIFFFTFSTAALVCTCTLYVSWRIRFIHRHSRSVHALREPWMCFCVCAVCSRWRCVRFVQCGTKEKYVTAVACSLVYAHSNL